jgi:hypothetical protein
MEDQRDVRSQTPHPPPPLPQAASVGVTKEVLTEG